MKTLLAASFLLLTTAGAAQITPGTISFALPDHPGSLSFNQGNFHIDEVSAKPNNSEFGVRANDGDLKFLGFLFLWPEKPHLTSESCRDEMLKAEGPQTAAADQGRLLYTSPSGVHTAMVLLIPPGDKSSSLRVFVAHEDLCADLLFTYAKPPTTAVFPMERTKLILNSLAFDPDAKPTFRGVFAYATVEWNKQQVEGAAKAYTSALKLLDSSDDPVKWRRVTTDQSPWRWVCPAISKIHAQSTKPPSIKIPPIRSTTTTLPARTPSPAIPPTRDLTCGRLSIAAPIPSRAKASPTPPPTTLFRNSAPTKTSGTSQRASANN